MNLLSVCGNASVVGVQPSLCMTASYSAAHSGSVLLLCLPATSCHLFAVTNAHRQGQAEKGGRWRPEPEAAADGKAPRLRLSAGSVWAWFVCCTEGSFVGCKRLHRLNVHAPAVVQCLAPGVVCWRCVTRHHCHARQLEQPLLQPQGSLFCNFKPRKQAFITQVSGGWRRFTTARLLLSPPPDRPLSSFQHP